MNTRSVAAFLTGGLTAAFAAVVMASQFKAPSVPAEVPEPAALRQEPARDAHRSELLQMHGIASGQSGIRLARPQAGDDCTAGSAADRRCTQ